MNGWVDWSWTMAWAEIVPPSWYSTSSKLSQQRPPNIELVSCAALPPEQTRTPAPAASLSRSTLLPPPSRRRQPTRSPGCSCRAAVGGQARARFTDWSAAGEEGGRVERRRNTCCCQPSAPHNTPLMRVKCAAAAAPRCATLCNPRQRSATQARQALLTRLQGLPGPPPALPGSRRSPGPSGRAPPAPRPCAQGSRE